MYKIPNDDTASNLRNSFVSRNADQTNYHLRNVIGGAAAGHPDRDNLCFLPLGFARENDHEVNNMANVKCCLSKAIKTFTVCSYMA